MKKIFTFAMVALFSLGTAFAQSEATKATPVEKKANYVVRQLPMTQEEGILESIIADHKGSVTVIDFWATWCGPCRAAMKIIDQIKPALMAKGVKFVYVTGASSPEKDWSEMIKAIDGEHYRLTSEQWNKVCHKLNMPGIPAYMILGKDGNVAFENVTTGGYPGNETVTAEVEKALKKK